MGSLPPCQGLTLCLGDTPTLERVGNISEPDFRTGQCRVEAPLTLLQVLPGSWGPQQGAWHPLSI